jgi:ferredoxin, 2Fe-2S
MKITCTDRTGVPHSVECVDGWTLMEGIRDAGLPIAAECGGCCLCSTCHVYVETAWLSRLEAPTETELMTLSDALDVRENSRLACQIKMHAELDGMEIRLAQTG